ncbi:MAG TPA: response regulator, partial [Pirellulaceae bacterium]|nr:response regulator [Pirellulaceae bacterium]
MENNKAKILIVDDLPEKLLVYRVILEDLGQELVVAQSGAEALRQVLAHDFAVILLDVNMPDMDGFETAAMIRRRKRSAHTPIIFVTAYADEVRISEGYAHGAVDYILAPVVPEILRAKIKVFVDLFRMTQQVKQQAEERIALIEERSMREAAEAANRHLSFLAHVGAMLGQSLDFDVTCRDAAQIAVPAIADQALVAYRSHAGGWMIHADEASREVSSSETEDWESRPADWLLAAQQALASGKIEFLPNSPAAPGGPLGPETIFLPLSGRGRTFAVLVLSRQQSGRVFESGDVTVAKALASRAAIALDNAALYRDIEQADRQKDEFLSMLAHELRNPLAPIRNAVAVLRARGQAQPDALWAQDVIDRQTTQLVRLVDDLLDVSRITQGKIRVELEYLSAASVVAGAVETSRPLIEAGQHRLTVDVPKEPIFIHADQARLSQVLSNLLNNAAKYTPEGGSICLAVGREGDDAVFRVRDNGLGIPPDMLAQIFNLFTQVERNHDSSQGGLGIGLTLVRRLVELHGGTVAAHSDGPGTGSEFVIRLPAGAAPREQPISHGNRPAIRPPHVSPLRILVVDDNADAADSLARLLRLEGHLVQTASDGLAAVQTAAEFRPDAAVL